MGKNYITPGRAYDLAKKAMQQSNCHVRQGCVIWDSNKERIFATGYNEVPPPFLYANSRHSIPELEVSAFQKALLSLAKVAKAKWSELEAVIAVDSGDVMLLEDAKLLLSANMPGVWLLNDDGQLHFWMSADRYRYAMKKSKLSL